MFGLALLDRIASQVFPEPDPNPMSELELEYSPYLESGTVPDSDLDLDSDLDPEYLPRL